MDAYRVWFSFGDDECNPRHCRIVASSEKEAVDILAKQLADNPEGFVISEAEKI